MRWAGRKRRKESSTPSSSSSLWPSSSTPRSPSTSSSSTTTTGGYRTKSRAKPRATFLVKDKNHPRKRNVSFHRVCVRRTEQTCSRLASLSTFCLSRPLTISHRFSSFSSNQKSICSTLNSRKVAKWLSQVIMGGTTTFVNVIYPVVKERKPEIM